MRLHRRLSLLAPLCLLALAVPSTGETAPAKKGKAAKMAKSVKPPGAQKLVKNAKASPLYQRSLSRGELASNGLETVQVANGTKMNFLRYVKGSALDTRAEFAPLFKPGMPAGVLEATPTYKEVIHQLEDRLIVERTLIVPLAEDACAKPKKLPKAVRGLCFRKGKGKVDDALKKELGDVRAKLAAADPAKVAKGTVTAEQAAKMSDAQLLELMLNHDDRTIRHVSVIPVMATDPSQPVGDVGTKLEPIKGQLPSKVKGGSTSPIKPPVHHLPVGAKEFDRKYFLTGFTFGRQFTDTWEYTIAGETWFTDRYYVKFTYLLSLGLGVRAPFSIDVKSAGNSSGGVDVEMSVDPVETDDQGLPAYPAVGLPVSKYFGGKEFVLEARATCNLYISIPGPNVDESCPEFGKNYSREIKPVIGSETSSIKDWWLPGTETGLGLSIGVAAAHLDLGLGAELTNGRVGMDVAPLASSSIAGVTNNRVSFTNHNPFTFKVNRSTATNDAGFALTKPRYGFDIRLVPKVRVKLEVDVAIYENDWILGPWAIDQLAVSVGFALPHHDGTVDKHEYKVFAGSIPDTVFDPGPASLRLRLRRRGSTTRSRALPGMRWSSIARVTDRVPSFFLLVPGPWPDAAAVIDVLARGSVDAVPVGDAKIEPGQIRVDLVHDDGFGQAFAYGRTGRLPADLVARAQACSSAALLEIGMLLDEDPRRVAAIGRVLRDAGGVAVRNEASGGAAQWDAWIEQLESDDPARLYANAVVVVGDEDGAFTCGMHQFDLPDAEMPDPASRDTIAWLEMFCVFQLAERPTLGSGHTFRPDAEATKRKIERWPDHRHHPDDGRHNPFGLWRVLAESDPGLDALDPAPTLIPALVATLLAAERSHGRALTQAEVEKLLDECPAIMMKLADAIALERSRGYADLEPRRAWAQWQLVREHYT